MMQQLEKWAARVLLLNSVLALAVSLGLLGEAQEGTAQALLFGAALLGFLSAALSLRRWQSGLWGALVYYALQVGSYFPLDGGWSFAVKAGVSLGVVMRFSNGVFVLNVAALVLLGITIAVLAWRRRSAVAASPVPAAE